MGKYKIGNLALMKRISLSILVVISFFIVGCETEVELNDDYEFNSYVFCLLDQNADTQFVRVNRAFLGSNSADDMVKYEDSINYKSGDLNVEIIDEGNVIRLEGDLVSKEAGYFNNSDYIVYYTTAPFTFSSADKLYELRVTNNLTGEVITGKTSLIDNLTLNDPNPNFDVSFIRNCSEEGYCFGRSFTINWRSSENAVKYEVTLRLVYDEIDLSTNDTIVGKYFDFYVGANSNTRANSGTVMTVDFSPELFYTVIGRSVETPPNTVKRLPRVEVLIAAAHEDLSLYIDATKPSNDINQNKPSYSNLSNGIGLFSSRNYRNVAQKQLPFNPQSIQKLIESDLTKHLNFRTN